MSGLTNRQFITISMIVMLCGIAVLFHEGFKTGKDMAYDSIALAYRDEQLSENDNQNGTQNTNSNTNDNNANNTEAVDTSDPEAEDPQYDGSETAGDSSSYSYDTRGDTSRNVNVSNSKKKFKYVGWIQIPKMGLHKGFLANKKNNLYCVDYNICAYNWEGNSPKYDNSKLVIGAHNGVNNNAYFRGIEVLKKGDPVYIEYKGKRYKYKLFNKSKSRKSKHSIRVEPDSGKELYLFTCAKEQHYALNYLVLRFKLEKEENM